MAPELDPFVNKAPKTAFSASKLCGGMRTSMIIPFIKPLWIKEFTILKEHGEHYYSATTLTLIVLVISG